MSSGTPTNLEFALLGLLHSAPQSGYDLRKVFAETAMGNYSSSPGAIYPALKRLERRQLIEGEVDRTVSLRPKKMFRPTTTGAAVFREWLLREISLEDVRRNLDELILRFAFYSTLDDAGSTRHFLEVLARRVDEYLQELLTQRAMMSRLEGSAGEVPIHARMAFEFGIEQYRAWGRWARRAMKRFEEERE